MRFKLFLFFLLFSSVRIFSQENVPTAVEVDSTYEVETIQDGKFDADSIINARPETSNTVYPKTMDPKFRERYKGEEFDYTTIKPKEPLMDKIMRKIRRILESIFGEMDPIKAGNITQTIFRILAIIVIAFILYFLIRFLVGKEGGFFFGKRNKKLEISDTDLHENIHEINFPESIAQFERQKDFRSAIRYQFLFVLKKLADKKLIDWNPENTNRDYLYQLKTENHKQKYTQLAYVFDHVWYGEFLINEDQYQGFKKQFQTSDF